MNKTTVRLQFLNLRLNLNRTRYWMLTDEIMDQIKLIDWTQYQWVHVFLPIRKNNEVDTFSILNYFKQEHPDLKIVVPRTNFSNFSITNISYDHDHTILGRNKYDIPEPIHGKSVAAALLDAIFIPLLACDLKGNRVGYGKGFYDRFLLECRSDVQKIGLSFFDPIEQIDGINEFDVPLDMCITPGKTWDFKELRITN